jgi:hypothetical protein
LRAGEQPARHFQTSEIRAERAIVTVQETRTREKKPQPVARLGGLGNSGLDEPARSTIDLKMWWLELI